MNSTPFRAFSAFLLVAVILGIMPIVSAVTCPRGYNVNEKGECYLETKEADDTKSMRERCDEFFPPECCQPPAYIEDPACPYRNADRLTQMGTPPDRPFSHSESRQIHQAVYDCLKAVGHFTPEQADGVQKNAQKCLASGDCTLQRNPASGHDCGLQSQTSRAGTIWEGIRSRDTKPSGLVQEAKAANNYAWYDWADTSKKAAEAEKALKGIAQEKEREESQRKEEQREAQSLIGQPLSTRFSSFESRATSIPWRAFDPDGNAIPEVRLEGDTPISLKSTLDDIEKGQPFQQEMPKASLLQKAVLLPSEPITSGEMTFTLNEKPQNLKIQEPESRYDVKSVFGLQIQANNQEIHPLSEALFYIKQPGGKLLRYDEQRRDWTPLEAENANGGFIARSPGNSYFAIVVEKQESSSTAGWVIIAIILAELAAVTGVYWLLRRKIEKPGKAPASEGKGIASLVLGILGIMVFWFPPVGLPFAGLAIVFSRVQAATKQTGMSIAGLVLGIIGAFLNAIILASMLLVIFLR